MILNILATTDVHGHIHSYDYISDIHREKGLYGLKDYIEKVRNSGPSVLVDIGDSFQGNPISHISTYLYSPQNHPMKIAFEQLSYDAVVVGNHDFNYGWRFVDSIFKYSNFAYMAANVLKNGKSAFIPYLPVYIGDVKIALFAVTTPAVPWFEHPDNISPYEFESSIESIKRWLPVLKQDFDHVILLAHMGFEKDPITGHPTRYLPFENALYEILETFKDQFPIILHGHTHERKDPIRIGNTWVIAPPPYAEGLMHIVLDVGHSHINVVDIIHVQSKVSNSPKFIEELHQFTKKYMNSTIGTLLENLVFTPVKDSSGMEYLLEIMERYSGAEISVQSFMGKEPFILPKGDIKIKDIYTIYPYENMLYVIEMTGEEIIKMLEKTAEYFEDYECQENLTKLKRNPLVAFYNFDIYRGFRYTIDLSKPFGKRVKADLDPNKTYKVAVNSYRAGGAGGYEAFRKARDRKILYSSNISIRDIIIRDIIQNGKIEVKQPDNNWHFLPECVYKVDHIEYDPV